LLATVWLYVDTIVEAEVKWWKWVPVLRYVIPAEVLYHEIGHHIHSLHRPFHDGRENVSEDWSIKLSINFCGKHYWYLFPFLDALARVAKRFNRTKRTARLMLTGEVGTRTKMSGNPTNQKLGR
jgi:hypothetical protein